MDLELQATVSGRPWVVNSGLLEEHQVPLTTDTSLLTHLIVVKIYFLWAHAHICADVPRCQKRVFQSLPLESQVVASGGNHTRGLCQEHKCLNC